MISNKYNIGQPYIHNSYYSDSYIAEEILSQLQTERMILWSWGANSFTSLGNALKFKVQGAKFTGEVIIILEPSDTYAVLFGKVINRKWIIQEVYTDIYCDNLIEVIDEYVET